MTTPAHIEIPSNQRDENRDQTFIALYAGGATMEEIAGAYGISRERVRQVLDRCGVVGRPGGRVVDASSIMAAIRRAGVTTLEEVTEATGHESPVVLRALRALGCEEAVRRLFRWRQEAPRRRHIIATVQALAARLGRTPTMPEMYAAKIHQNALEHYFGSQREAMRACGLVPRGPGEYSDTARRYGPRSRKEVA